MFYERSEALRVAVEDDASLPADTQINFVCAHEYRYQYAQYIITDTYRYITVLVQRQYRMVTDVLVLCCRQDIEYRYFRYLVP